MADGPSLRAIAFAGLCALIIACAGRPAYASGPQVKLAQQHTAIRNPVLVNVFVVSRVPLGAYTLQVSFNPAELRLEAIHGGSGDFAAQPFANPEVFATGVVRFSAFQGTQMHGPIGQCHVATLMFRPRGGRTRARVAVEAITLSDTLGSTYHPARRGRTLRLKSR